MNRVDPDGREIVFVIGKNKYIYNGNNLTNSKGNNINISKETNLGKIIQGYNDVLNSGDKVLKDKVTHLMESEKTHYILIENPGQAVNTVQAGSKGTTVSEDKAKVEAGIGIGSTTVYKMSGDRKEDSETVSHEMQHQYDFDTGNMKDDTGKSDARNPIEIRAVNTQNRMKKVNNTGKRTTYGGEQIDPKLLD